MTTERRHFLAGEAGLLKRINDPAVDLAVWRRTPPAAVKRYVASTPFGELPNATFVCRPEEVAYRLRKATGDESTDAWDFVCDVAFLGYVFVHATGATRLRVRVERVESDGCRKFHVDRVGVRLVCTYRGGATEWLPEHAVDRAALGTENARIVRSWNAVRRAPRYAVLLHKGELAAGENKGIVHRSPPVRRAEDARLVVVIDDADVAYR